METLGVIDPNIVVSTFNVYKTKNQLITPAYFSRKRMAASTIVNVQEMVRKDPNNIPQRYLRSEQERTGEIILCAASTGEIPVLDLGLLESGNVEELERLDSACARWGFFLVINHGIEEQVLQDMKKVTNEFFGLPIEEKTKCKSYGQAVTYTEGQTMDWSDSILLSITPLQNRKIELWPSTPTQFRDAAKMYATEVKKVAHKLLISLSLVMGMNKQNSLLQLHQNELSQAMRVNYCPPCLQPDQVHALSPHSDTTTISIIMQDDDVTALQIRHDGGWVPVKPLPNSLVVNVGDFLEIWSSGKYESVEHRVMPNQSKTRVSFATFFYPGVDVEVEPLDQMLNTEKSVKRYMKVNSGEYLKHALAKKLEGKSHTAFAKNYNK